VPSEVEDLVTAGNEALKAGDWVAAKRVFSAAYPEFRRRSDPVGAAECALALCIHYRADLGNTAASAGWLARATRLIEPACGAT
jgi:hypothetical protein